MWVSSSSKRATKHGKMGRLESGVGSLSLVRGIIIWGISMVLAKNRCAWTLQNRVIGTMHRIMMRTTFNRIRINGRRLIWRQNGIYIVAGEPGREKSPQ
jgi:hypothetical protein